MGSQVTNWGDSLMGSLTSAMSLFFAALPRLFDFIVIVIVGWIISALLAKAIAVLLREASFNRLAEREIIRNSDRRARTKREKTDKELTANRATDMLPKKGS